MNIVLKCLHVNVALVNIKKLCKHLCHYKYSKKEENKHTILLGSWLASILLVLKVCGKCSGGAKNERERETKFIYGHSWAHWEQEAGVP